MKCAECAQDTRDGDYLCPEHRGETPVGEPITDGNHALLVGEILGVLSKEFDVAPEFRDGNYADTIVLKRPSGEYIVRVERKTNTAR
jgi:hypothetical protein